MKTSFNVGDTVTKKSGKPFKNGSTYQTIVEFGINEQDPNQRLCAIFYDGSVCNLDMLNRMENKENKDNIFKLIARVILIGFLLFSMYIVAYPPISESLWLALSFCIGSLAWLGLGIILGFLVVGLCVFLVTRFLGWAFNTDYFD
jgi:hypothetical protein